MNDDVGAELERSLKDRRGKRVVHREEQAVGPRHLADSGEVCQPHHGIRGRFNKDHLSVVGDGRGHAFRVSHVYEREGHSESTEDLVHQTMRAPVDVLAADYVVSCR